MPSIVKVPRYNVYDDYDFIGFSFNGYHCIEDLGIIRVGNGTRYQENLTPQIQEQIGQHPGIDGAYFIGAQYRQKTFDIQFAFDGLTQDRVWKLHEVFSGENIHDLWFDEYPYKVWDAKVTGQPQLQVIPFDDGNGGVLYKGEGTVQFIAYYPYAHTPDFVQWSDNETAANWEKRDGRLFSSYQPFKNKEQWQTVADLWECEPNEGLDIRGEVETKVQIARKNTKLSLPDGYSISWLLEQDTTRFKIIYTVPNNEGQILNVFLEGRRQKQRLCYEKRWEFNSSQQNSESLKEIVQFNQQPNIEITSYYDEHLKKSLTKTIVTYSLLNTPDLSEYWLWGSFSRPNLNNIQYSTYNNTENKWTNFVEQVVNDFEIKKELNAVMSITIPEPQSLTDLSINSRTGLVSAKISNSVKPIYYKGRAKVDFEPGIYTIYGFLPSEASYHFWYY